MELIEALEAFSEPVEVLIKTRPLTSDPDDDMVMDVAINGVAEALVTGNTKHFASAGKRIGISGAFSHGTSRADKEQEARWRLNGVRRQSRNFRCG